MIKAGKWLLLAAGVFVAGGSALAATDIKTVTASVDSRNYTLTVASAHGTPVPSLGTNLYAWRTTVTCSVDSVVTDGLTSWISAGWSGSGSVPASGVSGNTGGILLTEPASSIVWNWNTDVLKVKFAISGSAHKVSWYGVNGRYYRLEYTGSLTNSWMPKGPVVSGANAQFVMDMDIGTGDTQFYRVRVSDSPNGL